MSVIRLSADQLEKMLIRILSESKMIESRGLNEQAEFNLDSSHIARLEAKSLMLTKGEARREAAKFADNIEKQFGSQKNSTYEISSDTSKVVVVMRESIILPLLRAMKSKGLAITDVASGTFVNEWISEFKKSTREFLENKGLFVDGMQVVKGSGMKGKISVSDIEDVIDPLDGKTKMKIEQFYKDLPHGYRAYFYMLANVGVSKRK